jgi:hypothetical protein
MIPAVNASNRTVVLTVPMPPPLSALFINMRRAGRVKFAALQGRLPDEMATP